MGALLFIAKYGVLLCGLLVILCSASKQVRQLALSLRHKNQFVQVLIFTWLVSLVVYGGSKPTQESDVSSKDGVTTEQSTQMSTGMIGTNLNTQQQPMGGNVANTQNSTTQTTLPQWYVVKGYSTTDADSDGIPDVWERWTHTQIQINDASADYDGDGVDNITEFMFMCDPQRSDTDGDGIDDRTEIDGLLAGVEELNPLERASFFINESDFDGDGINDIWDEVAYLNGYTLFSDENNNGYDDEYEERMPYEGDYNFDVFLTITTTRTALLSWNNDGIIIPPCTNKVFKLRLNGNVDTSSINLITHPEGTALSGLWKAQMKVEYDLRRDQETKQKRIKLCNGYYIDFDSMESEYIGYINSTQQYGRQNQGPSNKVTLRYESKYFYFNVDMTGVCLEHGPNPQVSLYATANVLPLWVSSGDETEIINDEYVDLTPLFSADLVDANPLCFSVYKEESSADLRIEGGVTIEKSKICKPAETNIVGAAWTSTHNPIDASDHLPDYEEVEVQFGPNCPVVTNINVKIGFSHDLVNTRNLPIIETSDKKDSADHCLGLVYSEQTIDLFNYIDWKFDRYKDDVLFVVNGEVKNTILITENTEVDRFHPIIYYVELRNRANNAMLDHMWITLNSLATQNEFNDWYIRNSNTNWIETLPKPSPRINITTNFWNNVVCSYPNASFSDFWGDASEVGSSYLHHNASFSARSVTIPGGHGNQACYDINGNIITSTIAGGTADYAAGKVSSFRSHIREDVNPYLDALQLDGNPGEIDWFNEIQRPCIYQGIYLNKYIERRPIIQPKAENQNENTN